MLSLLYQEIVNSWDQFTEYFISVFPKYFAGALVFLIFWIISRIEHGMTRRLVKKIEDPLKKEATILVARLTRLVLVIIGSIAGLSIIGVNWAALATGIGLVGFGVSFAFKDYIENFLAGVIILTQKPFNIGDQIEADEVHGIVEVIATRYTIIKSFEGRQVIVPNSDMLSKAITRDNAYGRRRYLVEINLDEGVNLEKALKEGRKVVDKTAGVLVKPKPRVIISEVSQGIIKLEFYFWANPKEAIELSVRSKVHQNLLNYYQEKGYQFGYETSAVVTKQRHLKERLKEEEEEVQDTAVGGDFD